MIKFELLKDEKVVVLRKFILLFARMALVPDGVCVTTGEHIEWQFDLKCSVY